MQALGINAGNLFVNLVCFAIAYLLIVKLVVAPIQKMLDKRKAVIEKGLEDAKVAAAARSDSEAERDQILNDAKAQAEAILADARKEADALRADYRQGLEDEVEQERTAMKQAIEKEREQMLSDMRGQIVELTMGCAQKMVGDTLGDEAKQRELADGIISGLKSGKEADLSGLPAKIYDLNITTAVPLTDGEKASLMECWSGKLSPDAVVKYSVDPSVIGGMVINAGNNVIDLSVAERIASLKKAVR